MNRYLILLILILFLVHCENESTNGEQVPFKGITETDSRGKILSTDEDDWGYDKYETVEYDTLQNGTIVPLENVIFPPYPNPAYEFINFKIGLPESRIVTVEIYSPSGDVVKLISPKEAFEKGISTIYWDLRGFAGVRVPAETYRAIVKYYSGNEVIFTEAGDIRIY